ncbi:hypothetical protein DRW42_09700 [Pedobacter miscanthi]|uniref:Uncharacterized protein n=2 Tax=Pedobacter miscanthi TaxID=2259170 RepID=A0A366L201_9SPHI|nr:hypothetical protein DRW42_09700 [Pedobacter miscanthi]
MVSLAVTHDQLGMAFFGAASILTQIITTKLSFILARKKINATGLNILVILISTISTITLAIHYLNADKAELLHFSRIQTQCLCIILAGIHTTFISNVRLPHLQKQISDLKCNQFLLNQKGTVYYIAGVVFGTAMGLAVYVSIGYILSLPLLSSYTCINFLIGMMLITVVIKRLWTVVSSIEISCTQCAGRKTEK